MVGPRYVEVSVQARVRALVHADSDDVRTRINEALNAFFDPRLGGPVGRGWPFGRDVYRSEVLQIIDAVNGVDHVIALSLSADGGEPQCGNLTLCPTWLVTPLLYQIEVVRASALDEPPTEGPVLPACTSGEPPE